MSGRVIHFHPGGNTPRLCDAGGGHHLSRKSAPWRRENEGGGARAGGSGWRDRRKQKRTGPARSCSVRGSGETGRGNGGQARGRVTVWLLRNERGWLRLAG